MHFALSPSPSRLPYRLFFTRLVAPLPAQHKLPLPPSFPRLVLAGPNAAELRGVECDEYLRPSNPSSPPHAAFFVHFWDWGIVIMKSPKRAGPGNRSRVTSCPDTAGGVALPRPNRLSGLRSWGKEGGGSTELVLS